MEAKISRVIRDPQFLLAMEESLCAKLAEFVYFKDHAVYFPTFPPEEAELLTSEKSLLIPLSWRGEYLCSMTLKGVDSRKIRKLLPLLPSLISLCMENLALRQASLLDSGTALYTEPALLSALSSLIDRFHHKDPSLSGLPALMIVRWHDVEEAAKKGGSQFPDEAWGKITRYQSDHLPPKALAANMEAAYRHREMAILLEAPTRGQCHGMAREILEQLDRLQIINPLSHNPHHPGLTCGHTLYPHDLSGYELGLPPEKQALILRDKARLAAVTGWRVHGKGAALSFSWLLRSGATITHVSANGAVQISLGKNSNASIGQRFHVFPPGVCSGKPKGQIILRKVDESEAYGDIFHIAHPDYPLKPGDRLVLLEAEGSGPLLGQRGFLDHFSKTVPMLDHFTLTITRMTSGTDAAAEPDIAALWQNFQSGEASNVSAAGFYGQASLIILWQGAIDEAKKGIHELHELGAARGLNCYTGLFAWPCLDYARNESEKCCLKALEYAELLPEPHIGELDDVALNISGDKLFSQGDSLAAISEYQKALLLQPNNPLVLNSLGISLASLGQNTAAEKYFKEALAACADESLLAQICYNLATVAQKENNPEEARSWYGKCIKNDPNYFYAWLGLGKIKAAAGRTRAARAMFNHAAHIAGNTTRLYNLSMRYLAKLEQKSQQVDKARELLHDTLLRDPRDTASLLMLASTYLEEDPALAELLARKSLRLGSNGYNILAQALEAQGRNEEAQAARQRT